MTLTASDFPAYFRAVHGYEPFPWQTRLAANVLDTGEGGGWPDVIAAPTSCGKTSVLDIALFALAAQPERFPRRIVMVIDRRVVVDQGALHAERIGERLRHATDPVARRVAEELRRLWNGPPDESPIECTVLRGGMPRDDAWARRPDRPVLALSTVDQVGSRLLFRGYGVSSRMASVHAGLLGHDTLFLLDEVHLSVPFAETLMALRRRWRGFWPNSLPDRWGVVRLSATPGLSAAGDRIFELPAGGPDDEHPRLKARLDAHKPAELREIRVQGRDESVRREMFVTGCVRATLELLERADDPKAKLQTIGVIVNRVAAAREIAGELRVRAGRTCDVQLLTGRMRPVDRDLVLRDLLPRIQAGRDRSSQSRPLIVVATQCIEAGADFDFDALVTECASFDALKQRFGRLDRLGDRHAGGLSSPAVIVARSDQLGGNADPDSIYGEALRSTWHWLAELGGRCDFGIRHLPAPGPERLSILIAPHVHAPVLLPAHLDAWSQTHPRPDPDPEVALWLHGPERGEPEIQVVWRGDIQEADLLAAEGDGDKLEDLIERLGACPPASDEAVALPLSAVRRWLDSQAAVELADAAMQVPAKDDSSAEQRRPGRRALHWAGVDSVVIGSGGLRPGMTLVVPSCYGGIAFGSWDPDSIDPVTDYGDIVQWRRYRRATMRLNDAVVPPSFLSLPLPRSSEEASGTELRTAVAEWLTALPGTLPEPWNEIVPGLGRNPRIITHRDGSLTLIARAAREGVSTEDDGASFTERETTLVDHSEDVWRLADAFACRLGLPTEVREDLVLAAWLHDVGKADPRFQKWLVGGSAIRLALLDEPLAKSAQTARDLRARERARQQAGYPDGYRHELLSLTMVARNRQLLERANDPDLVLHLIGSHHGWCRPFATFLDHSDDIAVNVSMRNGPQGASVELSASTRHQLARLDSGVTDRFWTLTERYGWWGLAWLEAILRLADHRASALAQGGK